LSGKKNVMEDEQVQMRSIRLPYEDQIYTYHYYIRFIREHTEMWFFTTGLGDQGLAMQLGDSFLTYVDKYGDPELGRIMWSVGLGRTAFLPFKGDFNIAYPWGMRSLEGYLNQLTVQPDLIVSVLSHLLEDAENRGIPNLLLIPGTSRYFTPLNLYREGLGYAGIDNKEPWVVNQILGPYLDDPRFEWVSKVPAVPTFTLAELNIWMNQKQILFGMLDRERIEVGFIPARFMETLGTGTPLVYCFNPWFKTVLGIDYPYQSHSREETVELVDGILNDFGKVEKEFQKYSEWVHKEHNYVDKIGDVVKKLESI